MVPKPSTFYTLQGCAIITWTKKGEGGVRISTTILLRPYFSTNPTVENPLKNPTSYLVKTGF